MFTNRDKPQPCKLSPGIPIYFSGRTDCSKADVLNTVCLLQSNMTDKFSRNKVVFESKGVAIPTRLSNVFGFMVKLSVH